MTDDDFFKLWKEYGRAVERAAYERAAYVALQCMHGRTYEDVGRTNWNNGIAEAVDAIRALTQGASDGCEPLRLISAHSEWCRACEGIGRNDDGVCSYCGGRGRIGAKE